MPLLKNGHETEDAFGMVADDAPLAAAPIIVSLKRYQAQRIALLEQPFALGVVLDTSENPEALGGDVHLLAVVALRFPLFKDGRVFSQARVVRTRMGYTGELRATGHFLIDQIAFLMRVGVDAFDLPPHISIADALAASHAITDVYQPASDHRRTIRELRAALSSPVHGGGVEPQ
jgi:uncharacterized protein (DUF934 family)